MAGYNRSIRKKYQLHRQRAKKRGISWEMTYIQWWKIWCESGHWHERGRKLGQYVMARFGDTGPYAPWNVKIIPHSENVREGNRGKKGGFYGKRHTVESRTKMSATRKGKHKGKKNSFYGKRHTLETREKMSKARREYLDQRADKLYRPIIPLSLPRTPTLHAFLPLRSGQGPKRA